MLQDGYQTLVGFSGAPAIKLYETEVTPPGVQGGGPIDQTTMRNQNWRTKAPKKLKELTEGSYKAAYDTDAYDDVMAQVNVNQEITITFPDDSTLTFWGYLDSFQPSGLSEGNRPLADVKIIPTLMDNNGVETAPVWADAA